MANFGKSETLALRKELIGPSLSLFFKDNPLKIVRAKGCYIYDESGKAYLDCINNVSHVGHSNPAITEAVARQMATLNTNTRYLHDNVVLLAQKLVATMPPPLEVCYFVNSGSEANDLALRLSRAYTKAMNIIVLQQAYHGHLTSLMKLSSYKKYAKAEGENSSYVHIAPFPDIYRGVHNVDQCPEEEVLSARYAYEVDLMIRHIHRKGQHLCGFIAESLLSCAGQIIPPKNFFKLVYRHVRDAGGVCIADEVQTGFGRVGSHYWAFQLQGPEAVPDIVTVGKPFGNGHPISAVITTRAIAEAFKRSGSEYFNTFGGNPVSCAAGLAVMDMVEKEGLQENARLVGKYLLDSLIAIKKQFEVIGDVRGVGLFIGIELVRNRTTKEPAAAEAEWMVYKLKDEGVILSTDGPDHNVLKFKPPIVFNRKDADFLLTKLNVAFESLKQHVFPATGISPGSSLKGAPDLPAKL